LHLSILSRERTEDLLAAHGLQAAVVDFGFFPMNEHFLDSLAQVEKVEDLSDAYHLDVGGMNTMVAYVLEIKHTPLPVGEGFF
jgi:hypothetical protein